MSTKIRARSAFVPHDIAAPIAGARDGPLAGLSAAVKDMYDIAGYRTGGGSPEWLATHKPTAANSPIVQKILDAGATIIGKTVCDEFFFSVTGANAHYGTPVNPRAPGRMPGGSSSGSASATAAGACDFALGSDTGGSVRMPASFCGLYGIRPTHGRVDLSGAMPMAPSFDVAGWFTNGPGVFCRVGSVLLQGERVAGGIENMVILDDAFAEAESDLAAVLGAALAAAAGELPRPRHETIAPEGLDAWREAFRVLQASEIWPIYGDFITREKPKLGPGVRERLQFASTVTKSDAAKANEVRRRARERVHALARPGTILALPTSPSISPLVDTPPEELEAFRFRVMRLTCISGHSGLPQVTIPIGTLAGCPIGLSFIGWAGGDEVLLDLTVKLSRYCGFAA
jgi:amidase